MFYYIRVVIYPMAVYAGSNIGLACSTAVQLMQVLLDLVVVDQFTPGYQFTPTLNFLEDL